VVGEPFASMEKSSKHTIKKKLKHGKLKEIMNMVRQWIHMVGFNMSWSHEPPKNWF
jgi:hypothetical protein